MTVGEFVKALQQLPQDAEITFTVGYMDEDREMYAFGTLSSDLPSQIKSCLEHMNPEKITTNCYLFDADDDVEVFLDVDLSPELMNEMDSRYQDYIKSEDGERPEKA